MTHYWPEFVLELIRPAALPDDRRCETRDVLPAVFSLLCYLIIPLNCRCSVFFLACDDPRSCTSCMHTLLNRVVPIYSDQHVPCRSDHVPRCICCTHGLRRELPSDEGDRTQVFVTTSGTTYAIQCTTETTVRRLKHDLLKASRLSDAGNLHVAPSPFVNVDGIVNIALCCVISHLQLFLKLFACATQAVHKSDS